MEIEETTIEVAGLRREVLARDWALIGCSTALGLWLVFWIHPLAALLTTAIAASSGALLGWITPALLHARVRSLPLVLLVPAVFGLGALWGGGSAAVSGLALDDTAWILYADLGMSAGALQLGVFLVPYVARSLQGRAVWPLVFAACLAAPLVGWVASKHVLA